MLTRLLISASSLLISSSTLAQSQVITTLAGTGSNGFSGDGGVATSAQLYPENENFRVAVDSNGNVYIADVSNHRIRKVTISDGNISTVAGNGTAGFSGDGGAATSASLNRPSNIAFDGSGNMYILDSGNNRVRKVVLSTGIITTEAGPSGLNDPRGLAVDTNGIVYVTNTHGGGDVKKIDSSGTDNLVNVVSSITSYPHDLTVDSSGNIFVTGSSAGTILKYSSGSVTTLTSGLSNPRAMNIGFDGYLYVAELYNHRVIRIDPSNGSYVVKAGTTGSSGFSGDGGAATSAQLNQPQGVAVDDWGNIFIGDTNNSRVRMVTLVEAKDKSSSGNENVSQSITLGFAGSPNRTLTYAIASGPSNGSTSLSGNTVTYTPSSGYNGSDSFTFTVSDGTTTSSAATVSITVNGVNNAPTATAQSVSVNEDAAQSITLAGSDPDGDSLTYAIASGPSNGSASLSGNTVTYTPTANYSGSDSFTFTVSDGTVTSSAATVSITVNAVNDAPTATAQSVYGNEDTAQSITLAGSDPEGSSLTYAIASAPSNGSASLSGNTVTYTPTSNYSGSDSFTFTVSDGSATSSAATVSITVNAVNDAPTATARSISINEGISQSITLAGSDPDGDSLTYAIASSPSNGSASLSGNTVTYTPSSNYSGTDSFTFTVSDGSATSSAATVSIAVIPQASGIIWTDKSSGKIQRSDLNGSNVIDVVVGLNQPVDIAVDAINEKIYWTEEAGLIKRVNLDGSSVETIKSGLSNKTFIALDVAAGYLFWSLAKDPGELRRSNLDGSNEQTIVSGDRDKSKYAKFIALDSENNVYYRSNTPGNTDYHIRRVNGSPGSSVDTLITGHFNSGLEGITIDAAGEKIYYGGIDSDKIYRANLDGSGEVDLVSGVNPAGIAIDVSASKLFWCDSSSGTISSVGLDGSATSSIVTGLSEPTSVTSYFNKSPTATAQSVSGNEDAAQSITLAGSDPNGDSLTYAIASTPSNGSASLSGNTVTYTPSSNYSGTDSFTFTVSDGSATSSAATVSITINAVNDAPTATAQSVSGNEDAAQSITLAGSDPEGSSLTYAIASAPTNGSASLSGNTVTYTPTANYNGSDSFTFTASDGTTTSSAATVSITVNAVNDAPTATAQSVSVNEDAAQSITLAGNDPDGDSLTYAIASSPSNGSASLSGNTVTYTPTTNYSGSDSFTFTISDGTAISSAATVSITINAVNDAPTATAQSVSGNEDATQSIILAGSDPDGDSLTYAITSAPSNGSTSLSGNTVTYTPTANYSGTDSFTFTASDGSATSSAATVSITINAVNDAPTATAQSVSGNEDVAQSITLAGSDPEGSSLTYAIASAPTNGSASLSGNTVTYTPTANYNGSDSFTFTASDGTTTSSAATVSITINAVNDAPTATAQSVSVNEDAAQSMTLAGSDPDGDSLTYAIASDPSNGSVSLSGNTLAYTPTANYNGSDSFTFTASDGTTTSSAATVSITINAVNDAPTATAQSVTVVEDATRSIILAGSDPDGDSLTYAITSAPSNGSTSLSGNTVTYTPTANYSGSDSFTFTASDGSATSSAATVSITVSSVNNTPTATAQSVSGNEDAAQSIILAGSDPDGDSLTYAIASAPTNGSASLSGNTVTYTPTANYNGSDSFTFTASDGTTTSSAATVSITINAVNDAPTATAQSVSVNEDAAQSMTLAGSDPDGDSLTYAIASDPSNGSVSLSGNTLAYTPTANYNGSDSFTFTASDGTTTSSAATVSITVNAVNDAPTATAQSVSGNEDATQSITLAGNDLDGNSLTYAIASSPSNGSAGLNGNTVTYTPTANYNGSDSFTFTASDGTTTSSTATVSITVNAVNDAPTATAQSVSVNEDAAQSITLAGSDPDGDSLTYAIASSPSNGSADLNGNTVTYTPTANYNGSDSFTFTVSDGTATSSAVTVSITVNAVNDAPTATAQSVTIVEGISQLITLSGGDPDGDSLTYTIASGPSNGSASLSGNTVTYTPTANYSGSDSFTFTVSDGTVTSSAATVSITVSSVNNTPTATAQSVSGNEDAIQSITLAGNDLDRDSLTYAIASSPSNGSASLSGNTVTYTPTANYSGSDSFTFTASDGTTTSSAATVSITINAVNDAPTATAQSVTVVEDATQSIILAGSDPDGDSLTYAITSAPSNGSMSLRGNIVTYTPTANYSGSDSLTFTVSDGTTTSSAATVSITINAVNDAPTATAQSVSVNEDATQSITLAGSDPDGDSLTYAITSAPSNGSTSLSGNTVTYTPTANYSGSDSFTFTASDGTTTSSAATVSITVNAVNDAPTAVAQSQVITTLAGTGTNGFSGDGSVATSAQLYPESENFRVAVDSNGDVYIADVSNHRIRKVTISDGKISTVAGNGTAGFSGDGGAATSANLNRPSNIAFDGSGNMYILDSGNNRVRKVVLSTGIITTEAGPSGLSDPRGLAVDTNGVVYVTDTHGSFSVKKIDSSGTDNLVDVVSSITNYPHDLTVDSSGNIFVTGSSSGNILKRSGGSTTTLTSGLSNPRSIDIGSDGYLYVAELYNHRVIRIDPSSGSYVVKAGSTGSSGFSGDGGAATSAKLNNPQGVAVDDWGNIFIGDTNNSRVRMVTLVEAKDKSSSGNENVSQSITLGFAGSPNRTLTYAIASGPSNGSTSLSGNTVTYTPSSGYNGSDSFTFTVSDGTTTSSAATVSITVNAVNGAPTATAQSVSGNEDEILSIILSGSDADGDSLTYSIASGPLNGSASLAGNTVTYTPTANYNGSDSFTFTVSDRTTTTSDTAEVSIMLESVNDLPIAMQLSSSGEYRMNQTVILSGYDLDGDTLDYLLAKLPENGDVALNDSTLVYTPDRDFVGIDSLSYLVSDGKAISETASVSFEVVGVDESIDNLEKPSNQVTSQVAELKFEGNLTTSPFVTNEIVIPLLPQETTQEDIDEYLYEIETLQQEALADLEVDQRRAALALRDIISRAADVDPRRVIIKSIRLGSIIVDFEVIDLSNFENGSSAEEVLGFLETTVEDNPDFLAEAPEVADIASDVGSVMEFFLIESTSEENMEEGIVVEESPIQLSGKFVNEDQGQRIINGINPGELIELQLYISDSPEIKGWAAVIEIDPDQVRFTGLFSPSSYIASFVPLSSSESNGFSLGGSTLGTNNTGSGDGILGQFALELLEGFNEQTTIRIVEVTLNLASGERKKLVVNSELIISQKTSLIGDFNKNGKVEFNDFFIFVDGFGGSDPILDLDRSGKVDFNDFFIFVDNFGNEERAKLIALAVESIGLPKVASLEKNYPNPFNSQTTVPYSVGTPGLITIRLYDMSGQLIRELVKQQHEIGLYETHWDGRNSEGAKSSSGVYIVSITNMGYEETTKIMLIK